MPYSVRVLVFGLLCLVGLSSVYAQKDDEDSELTVAPEAILYEADFEAGTIPPDLFILTEIENISVRNGVLVMDAEALNGFFLDATGEWTDYSFQVRLRVSGTPSLILYSRIEVGSLCGGGYATVINNTTNITTLEAFATPDSNDCSVDVLDNTPTGEAVPASADWLDLRFDVQGEALSVFINDEQTLSATDERASAGGVGVFADGETVLEVEEFRVVSLNSAPSTATTTQTQDDAPPPPVSLTAFAEGHSAATTELDAQGLIPAGGSRLFQEPYVFARAGSGYVPLARRANVADAVIAGEFTLNLGEEDLCGFMLRVTTQGSSAATRVYAGITGDGRAFLLDFSNPSQPGQAQNGYALPITNDLSEPVHIIVSVVGDSATLYVDGAPVLQDVAVAPGSGAFGLGLLGEGSSSCEAREVWVHQFE